MVTIRSYMSRQVAWREGCVVGIFALGLVTLFIHGYHFFEEDALSQVLTGVIPPALVSIGLMAEAVFLYRSDFEDRYLPRLMAWTIGGTIGLAALGYALMLYQLAHGAAAADFLFIEVSWAATGGFVGFLIGYYNANLYRVRDRLAEERDRLARREAILERENERQEQLVQVVSHDLRNPLNVARGRLELYQDSPEMGHIENAQSSLERMETIIEDMLSMVSDGRRVEDIERTEVSLRTVAERSWNNVETARASLDVESDCSLWADEGRLQHLFENLYRNAVEHGGPDVTVRVGRASDGRGFYVEDSGPGLPGDRPVFEAGFTTRESGTGLGLAIVQDIATAHGWKVKTTEGTEGGARFEIVEANCR